MKTVSLFNNKGGVGKSTLTYHIGFALERLGKKVLFVDGDPQCNLSAHVCSDEVIDDAWKSSSLYQAVYPLVSGAGDFSAVTPYKVPGRNIWLFIGDLLLSDYESLVSQSWTEVLAAQERGFRASSALYRLYSDFAKKNGIDFVLVDVGPNLGALNRALLLGCDYFIVPMIPDLFSLRGSQNLGRVLVEWAKNWNESLSRSAALSFDVQKGAPIFAGYVLQHFNIYRQKPTKAWKHWSDAVPSTIRKYVVNPLQGVTINGTNLVLNRAHYRIGEVRNYHSLIPMAQDALKPVCELTSKDGVIGGHNEYVVDCRKSHERLATAIINL